MPRMRALSCDLYRGIGSEGFLHIPKLAASIFIQSQSPKVYLNEMQVLAASLQVGFAIIRKEP